MFKLLSVEEIFSFLKDLNFPHQKDYLAMYSSFFGGVITEPNFMLLPIDDHMVHRGDGVFEVIKFCKKRIYQFDAHLERLKNSANLIGLKIPFSLKEIKEIVKETIKITKANDGIIHIYISRGFGSFSVNPFETIGSQLYVVITRLKPLPARYEKEGVKVIISKIPIKPGFFAQIKSCNYLSNVLMKKEALEAGADFAISLDEDGFLAEGATESIGLVSKDNYLKFPEFKRVLKGITLQRAMILAENLVKKGLIKGVKLSPISLEDAYNAKEILLLGTTIDVLPVTWFEGKIVGDGKPGPVARNLKNLFEKDIFSEEVSEPV